MLKFFRNIRHGLIGESKFSKCLIYAFGEVVLVVIGLLIALRINNKNEANKTRARDLHYLKNIKTDLLLNINNIDSFIEARNTQIPHLQ